MVDNLRPRFNLERVPLTISKKKFSKNQWKNNAIEKKKLLFAMDSNHYCVVAYALSHSAIREVIVLFSFFNIVLNFVRLLFTVDFRGDRFIQSNM